jgi:hypothetical protein
VKLEQPAKVKSWKLTRLKAHVVLDSEARAFIQQNENHENAGQLPLSVGTRAPLTL